MDRDIVDVICVETRHVGRGQARLISDFTLGTKKLGQVKPCDIM